MRKLLTILLLLICVNSFATNYYFSAAGNDGANGLTPGTAWRTLGRMNTGFIANTFASGDSLLLRRGDTFVGTIIPTRTYAVGNPIKISAYGTGANPIISGFATATGFTRVGTSNVWQSAVVSTLNDANVVLINGVNTAMGRIPNADAANPWYTISSHTNVTAAPNYVGTLTSLNVNAATTNWTGADLVMKTTQFTINRDQITNHTGNTLTFLASANSDNNAVNNWGFFIENDVRTLDQANEWFYSGVTKRISVFSTTAPTSVQVSTLDTLVYQVNADNYVYDGIDFIGANRRAFFIGSSANVVIRNCNIRHSLYGVWGGNNFGTPGSTGFIFNNNAVTDIQSQGIYLASEFPNPYIHDNVFLRCGIPQRMGMFKVPSFQSGRQWSGAYGAIKISNNTSGTFSTGGLRIEYNRMDSTGYAAAFWLANNANIAYNYVTKHCLILQDGGGLYTWTGPALPPINVRVHHNIVNDGTGNNSGTTATGVPNAHGIYIDDGSSNTRVDSNFCYNNAQTGFYFHNTNASLMRYNTSYNNGQYQMLFSSSQATGGGTTPWIIRNDTIKTNIFFCRTAAQIAIHCLSLQNDALNFFSSLDSNYYARPIDDNLTITSAINTPTVFTSRNLAQWKTYINTVGSIGRGNITNGGTGYNAGGNGTFASLALNGGSGTGATATFTVTGGVVTNCVVQNPGINYTVGNVLTTGALGGTGSGFTFTVAALHVPREVNSNKSPVTITNVNQLFHAFSTKLTDSVVTLPAGTWIDVRGVTYNTGTITLTPFSSAVLINTGANLAPVADAGTSKNITLPTSTVTQIGSGTDPDGTITGYLWTQFSGPATVTFGTATASTTTVNGMTVAGTYVVQIRVTDNFGLTATDTASIIVNATPPVNIPPTANAGGNKIITLPTTTVTQAGSGTDPDGTIASYAWTQASGPVTATIVSPTSATTVINGLTVAGTYRFTLTVTDNLGATGSATATIIVNTPFPVAPTANAGSDQTLTWPTNSATLSGSGTDPDGTIVGYSWTKTSGGTATITNPTSASTTVTGLDIGVYQFQLQVTDNTGLTATDVMQIIVNMGTASITQSNLSAVFNNTPQGITVTTNPAGLSTSTTYNGVTALPINVGSYTVVSGVTDPHYFAPTVTNTFTITKGTVVINVSNLLQSYDNTPKPVTLSSTPNVTGLSATYTGISGTTYATSATAPTNAGTYRVNASLTNANWQATPTVDTLIISKINPTINAWNPLTPITYGSAISSAQNNLTSPIGGVFTYSPANGFVPSAGTLGLSATFTPTDLVNYNVITGITSSITVNKATAIINVSNTTQDFDGLPKPITVSTTPAGLEGSLTILYNGSPTAPSAIGSYPFTVTMSNSNYTATAVSGTLTIVAPVGNITITNFSGLVYTGSPITPTVTSPYTYTITYNGSATAPTVPGNYTTIATINDGIHVGADTVIMSIVKATPTGTWTAPASITTSTALSGTQNNASFSVAGTVTYSPANGSFLSAGTQLLSATLVPTNTNYNTITITVPITVTQATATMTLSGLSYVYDNTDKQAIVTTSPAGLSGVTILYNGSATLPHNADTYNVTVTLNNPNVTAAPISGTLVISKASGVLSWPKPGPLSYGLPLTTNELDATSTIPGTFSYSSPLGTVLPIGVTGMIATFTPTDSVNYNGGTVTQSITVYPVDPFLDFFISSNGHYFFIEL